MAFVFHCYYESFQCQAYSKSLFLELLKGEGRNPWIVGALEISKWVVSSQPHGFKFVMGPKTDWKVQENE
jgi:hypothetical protein